MSRSITVTGMHCGGCESAVEAALEAVDGVETAAADRQAERATVEGDADVGTMIAAVEEAGHGATA